jgi:hypothetical protein
MTAILARQYGQRWLVGGDRALTTEDGAVSSGGPKVLSVGRYVLAVAGAIGGWWELTPDLETTTPWDLLARLGPGPDAEVLIAERRTLWAGQYHADEERWSLRELRSPVTGIGAGAAYGVGALLTYARPRKRETADRQMRKALAICAQCHATVRGPYDLLWS